MAARLVVKDYRGRELQEGDEIILNVQGPLFFRVVAIRPDLRPTADAPNYALIDVAATHSFVCARGMPEREFIRVRTAQEAGPLPFVQIETDEKKILS